MPKSATVSVPRVCGDEENLFMMKLTLLVRPDATPDGVAGFSSLCPELDIASQGQTEDEARENLREALELFLEDASQQEIEHRLSNGARVTQLELAA